MFIFDEAQLLKEEGRGFTLESVIAMLDYLTRNTDHQVVLISAAMGNAGAIAQWLGPEQDGLLHESDWRGPRRLHAVFNTRAQWGSTTVEGGAGHVWRYRHTTELTGEIRVRMANGKTSTLATQDDTGWRLVRKSKDGARRPSETKPDESSTKQYVIASDMITALGHAGSVLIVASTKAQAQLLAKGIALSCPEQPSTASLVDFVRQQLGDSHPLIDTLRHGVGFHHAGLPVEVLEALEAAVREDSLPYLTCTSTLTDGVNLPVRTVVLYDQGYPGQPEDSRLRGARLVNAIGRAGRAGKETEGWIVLIRAAEPSEQDFRDLAPDSDTLAVTSSLLTEAALHSVAQLEAQLRDRQDAIFTATGAAADFINFVWLMLATEESNDADPVTIDVEQIVNATLGATQSAISGERYAQIAHATHRQYLASDPQARRRWPRTGTTVGSAREIDTLAIQLAQSIIDMETLPDIGSSDGAISYLSPSFRKLLTLPEAPSWAFRTSPRGDPVEVSPGDLLRSWVSGESLSNLADTYLEQTEPASWRIEQMVGVVTQQFEHYLAWTVGALVELVNDHLESAGLLERLCPRLSSYIRYGVNSAAALQLMTSGVRSRRLANAIAANLPAETLETREDLRAWLSAMTVAQWRARYDASSSEVLDLLEFARVRRRSLLKTLLEIGAVSVTLEFDSAPAPVQELVLRPLRDEPFPAPLGLYAGGTVIATVASEDHADTQVILDTGFAIDLSIDPQNEPRTLLISLGLEDDR